MPGLSPALFLSRQKTLFNTLNKNVHRRANRFSGMVSAHCRNGLRLFAKRQFDSFATRKFICHCKARQVTDPDICRDTTLDAFDTYKLNGVFHRDPSLAQRTFK